MMDKIGIDKKKTLKNEGKFKMMNEKEHLHYINKNPRYNLCMNSYHVSSKAAELYSYLYRKKY